MHRSPPTPITGAVRLLVETHGSSTTQDVPQLSFIDAHAPSSFCVRQPFADDETDRGPVQRSLRSFVVTHDSFTAIYAPETNVVSETDRHNRHKYLSLWRGA